MHCHRRRDRHPPEKPTMSFCPTLLRDGSRCLLAATLLAAASVGFADDATVETAASEPVAPVEPVVDAAALLKRIDDLADQLQRVRAELEQLKAERAAERARLAEAMARAAVPPAPPPAPAITRETEVTELDDEQARLERERAVRAVQRSGVLLPRNSFEVEPAVTYTHSSANLISIEGFSVLPVIVIGEIESLRVERDVVQPSLTLRYGILDNLQADVFIPYRFQRDRFVRQVQDMPRIEQSFSDHGIGDVEFGLSYQLLYERGWIPDLIFSSRARTPTAPSQFDIDFDRGELALGSGVWGVRNSFTAVKTLDPVILVLTAGYTHNLDRDFTVFVVDPETEELTPLRTVFEPGGTFDYSVAVALAMNPVFAVNLQLQQRITFGTRLKGIGSIEGSSMNQADIRFGFAWALTRNSVLNFTVAGGLTEDTPDLTVQLALPIRF
jgi:hypothetical protein